MNVHAELEDDEEAAAGGWNDCSSASPAVKSITHRIIKPAQIFSIIAKNANALHNALGAGEDPDDLATPPDDPAARWLIDDSEKPEEMMKHSCYLEIEISCSTDKFVSYLVSEIFSPDVLQAHR